MDVLLKMKEVARDEIEIIPAGKITNQNIADLHRSIGCNTHHGRRILGSLPIEESPYFKKE